MFQNFEDNNVLQQILEYLILFWNIITSKDMYDVTTSSSMCDE